MHMREFATTGIKGLDTILFGGYPKGSTIIIEGAPGTGKTTLGFQFLYEGALYDNEPGIYITFEELPGQLYQDMMTFGWDIKRLEKENKLKIVCISPEVLLEQLLEPNSFFEKLMKDMDCKRIVIDSINLFPHQDREQYRSLLYRFRNTLRKFNITSLLIREQTQLNATIVPFEHYVVDGVIRLSLQELFEKYRKRTLEVLKMRGSKIIEGEHIYRINEDGIHLIPARSMVEDISITLDNSHSNVPTGIKTLDKNLGGGIAKGSLFLLDTNSKANYKYVIASILASRLLAGEKAIMLPSSNTSVNEMAHMLQLYGVNLQEFIDNDHIYFIEQYKRASDDDYKSNIINTARLTNDEFLNKIKKELSPIMELDAENDDQSWFVFYDLNSIFTERGKDFVIRFFAEEASHARNNGYTILSLCNFSEIGKEISSYLERTCNGVIRTWVDGNYQYLQVTKSPSGQMSEPYLIENIAEKPFIQLV
jgi:circadian clock protein KaiC